MTAGRPNSRLSLALAAALALAALVACACLIDLKGISTDEGFRLGIVNGGRPCTPPPQASWAGWDDVLTTIRPHAYQPAFYLFLNSLMRAAERQDLLFFRTVNLGFLAVALAGLLGLSRGWAAWPRAFLFGLFGFNAYLFMHVLQVREYVATLALFVWSTRLVLHLDQRELRREWPDVGVFALYGLLLTLGFYLQTWFAFPAAGQFAFLVLRRRPGFARFAAHLAFSGLVAFVLIWPYLRANGQKADVGLWNTGAVTLGGQLWQGFSLLLSGQPPRHDALSTIVAAAWLALLAGAAWFCWRRAAPGDAGQAETRRQVRLMLPCLAVPLAFQVGYFLRVEPLSMWPRYFVVHYFFLTWLIALAFRSLLHARATAVAVAASVLLAVSAVHQVRSFHRDPYFDTSMDPGSDWRTGTALFDGHLRADDVVVIHDFVTRSTLTFTRPLAQCVLIIPELEAPALKGVRRVLYLQSAPSVASRDEITARLAGLGFGAPRELAVSAGQPGFWHLLAYERP